MAACGGAASTSKASSAAATATPARAPQPISASALLNKLKAAGPPTGQMIVFTADSCRILAQLDGTDPSTKARHSAMSAWWRLFTASISASRSVLTSASSSLPSSVSWSTTALGGKDSVGETAHNLWSPWDRLRRDMIGEGPFGVGERLCHRPSPQPQLAWPLRCTRSRLDP